jgi:hypothetical protein
MTLLRAGGPIDYLPTVDSLEKFIAYLVPMITDPVCRFKVSVPFTTDTSYSLMGIGLSMEN